MITGVKYRYIKTPHSLHEAPLTIQNSNITRLHLRRSRYMAYGSEEELDICSYYLPQYSRDFPAKSA